MKEAKEPQDSLENLAARRGIYYQAFSIYKEVGGFFDYGPIGLRIKRNIENLWRKIFVEGTGSLEIESTLIMPESVFRASGHLASFTDPLVICSRCKHEHRADKLLEAAGVKSVESMSLDQMMSEIREKKIKCPDCKGDLGKAEEFNMMFKTEIGALGGEKGYLRPETAQGIFVDFRNLHKIYGLRMPAGIAQVGKVFRNEISPRQHLIRLREFSQMELEIFFDPREEQKEFGGIKIDEILDTKIDFLPKGSETVKKQTLHELVMLKRVPNKLFALLLQLENKMLKELGFEDGLFRFREIEKPPHYSGGNVDIEVKTSHGWIEISGNAYRTDYDLSSHSKLSGSDLSIVNEERKDKFMPHVVEASIGMDRLLFALLENNMKPDKERGWTWINLNDIAAPYKFAVFPLQKDDKLVEKAKSVSKKLTDSGISNYYSETSSIGKRYAKADEVGVPYCVTIDYQTLEDSTVTVRNIKDAKQVRKRISELNA